MLRKKLHLFYIQKIIGVDLAAYGFMVRHGIYLTGLTYSGALKLC